jgi:hypothetical protein
VFWTFGLRILNLFGISDFEFRIFSSPLVAAKRSAAALGERYR